MKKIIYVGSGVATAAVALALAVAALPLRPATHPNSNTNRPGADPQANVGATVNDPAFATSPNAQNNPPEQPPGTQSPDITEEERKNVNPDQGEEVPNVSRTIEERGADTVPQPQPGSKEWREQRE